jgi:inner membrane protein
MDSLTQIVLGAAVGEVVLGKKAGNRAMLWGAIAGTIPDLDVVVNLFTDDLTANELHRGVTHSLVFSVLMAPALAWLITKIYRRKPRGSLRDWTKLSFWAFVTHPLLDCHTTWGTQFFWPFDLRIAYQNINVVDPIYTVPFLIILLVVLFIHREKALRRKLTWIGIGLSSLYMVYTIGLKFYVMEVFESSFKHEEKYRMSVSPGLGNTILWMSMVETEDNMYFGTYSLMDEDKDVHFALYPKQLEKRESLRAYRNFQRLEKLTKGWYLLDQKEDTTYLCDMRFGKYTVSDEQDFTFRYTLEVEDNHMQVTQERPDPERFKGFFPDYIDRVLGKEFH